MRPHPRIYHDVCAGQYLQPFSLTLDFQGFGTICFGTIALGKLHAPARNS